MTTNVRPEASSQAPRRHRPRIVDVADPPTAFSSRGSVVSHDNGRALPPPRIANGEPHPVDVPSAPPDTTHTPGPAPVAADGQASQRLVRYKRQVPIATAEDGSPAPERRAPARRARSTRPSAGPDDLTEDLLVVVAEHLGFDVPSIARSLYGHDDASSRARIASILKGLGPRGKVMALRLASILLNQGA